VIEISDILSVLAKQRPVFHSEADFQHAFAWEIHQRLPHASVRLELPVQVKHQYLHIDIWCITQDDVLAIELKYKTRELSVEIGDEQYKLKSQSAQDIGRYDYVKDIYRLEQTAITQRKYTGYAILLTNDSAYWIKPSSHNTVDAGFRIREGRVLEGVSNWGANASDGTKKNREQPLTLQNRYQLQWTDFSRPSLASYGLFRSLTVKVTQNMKEV
jgi:hypothetical protein